MLPCLFVALEWWFVRDVSNERWLLATNKTGVVQCANYRYLVALIQLNTVLYSGREAECYPVFLLRLNGGLLGPTKTNSGLMASDSEFWSP